MTVLGATIGIGGVLLAKNIMKSVYPSYANAKCITSSSHKPPYNDILKSAIISRYAYEDPTILQNYRTNNVVQRNHRRILEQVLPDDESTIKFFDASKTNKTEDTQAYLWCHENTLYLAFRGTEDMLDILADVDVRPHQISSTITVHRGFYEQFSAIADDLMSEINTIIKNTSISDIWVTGHSLGGALATITALHLSQLYPYIIVRCHTFGCPRVGNKEFDDTFNKHVNENWRVINIDDPVPMIPLSFRFSHVAKNTLCLGKTKRNHVVFDKDIHWLLRPLLAFIHIDLCKPITPHQCDIYIDKLLECSDAIY